MTFHTTPLQWYLLITNVLLNQVIQRHWKRMGIASLKPDSGASAARGTQPVVAWEPTRDLARREWLLVGKRLGGISRCNQWWLGDWVRYGADKWGEKYTQAAKITGYDPRSLANMASIATAFEPSRRRDNLTWSHHVAVAALPEGEQETWLDRAVSEGFSVADLRTELRAVPKAETEAPPADLGAGEGERQEADEKLEEQEHDPEVLCPRCGYRLAGEALG